MEVEVFADYICPWCYRALEVIDWLVAEKGCAVDWQPFELASPRRTFDSRPAMEIGELARSVGALRAWNERVFIAHFVDRGDISDPALLTAAAADVGIDPSAARAALADRRFAPAVDAARESAIELGIAGVPAFVFRGDSGELVVPGIQERAVFARVVDRMSRRARDHP